VLFEGGDPAELPIETRAQILRESCEQLAQPAHGRSVTDYSAVQRFTNADLAEVIRELLDKYEGDDDIVWFLLRMVYQGGVGALADKAKHFALNSRHEYTRIAAIRAVLEIGSAEDADEVRKAFVTEDAPLRRSWLGELLDGLGQSHEDVDWLIATLELVAPKKQTTPSFAQKAPLRTPLRSRRSSAWPASRSKRVTRLDGRPASPRPRLSSRPVTRFTN
jgi:hypothetical protein